MPPLAYTPTAVITFYPKMSVDLLFEVTSNLPMNMSCSTYIEEDVIYDMG